jgi:hypothetical protein
VVVRSVGDLIIVPSSLNLMHVMPVIADDLFTEEQNEMVESAAEMLYGLIHVRYILTSKGMNAMVCSLFLLCV